MQSSAQTFLISYITLSLVTDQQCKHHVSDKSYIPLVHTSTACKRDSLPTGHPRQVLSTLSHSIPSLSNLRTNMYRPQIILKKKLSLISLTSVSACLGAHCEPLAWAEEGLRCDGRVCIGWPSGPLLAYRLMSLPSVCSYAENHVYVRFFFFFCGGGGGTRRAAAIRIRLNVRSWRDLVAVRHVVLCTAKGCVRVSRSEQRSTGDVERHCIRIP